MSKRADKRRHDRATAKLECSVCAPDGPEDHRFPVVWADIDAPDPEYRAICAPHLGYALTTLFWGETIPDELPPPPRRERQLPILVAKARRDIDRPRRKRSDKRHLDRETCEAILTSVGGGIPEPSTGDLEALRSIDLDHRDGEHHLRRRPPDVGHATRVAVAAAKRSAKAPDGTSTLPDRGGAP